MADADQPENEEVEHPYFARFYLRKCGGRELCDPRARRSVRRRDPRRHLQPCRQLRELQLVRPWAPPATLAGALAMALAALIAALIPRARVHRATAAAAAHRIQAASARA
jgi:hypothetical protein